MRKSLWIIGLALVVPAVASAQDAPRIEVFGGYSYGLIWGYVSDQLVPNSGTGAFPRFGSNGWTGSVAVNATRWFGVEAEAGGQYTNLTRPAGGIEIDLRVHEHSYLAGPRVSYGPERWTLFAHALFGESHATVVLTEPEALTPIGFVETRFAMAMGGGFECSVLRKRPHPVGRGWGLAIRPMQLDWLRTGFAGSHQGILRLSAGLAFRF